MPEQITLAEAKTHLRVLHDDDDTYIATLISAARQYAEGYQNRVYLSYTQGEGENAVTVPEETMPALVKAACLLIVGHLYEHREAVNIGNITTEIPLGVRTLLNINRNMPV